MFDPEKCIEDVAPGWEFRNYTTQERLDAQLDKSGGPDACWPFTGWKNKKGYGRIRHEGRKQLAHRVALKLSGVELRDDQLACHSCDNPPCCNPRHLHPATTQENVDERERKGRGRPPPPSFGDSHPNSLARQFRVGKCYVRP